MNKSCRTTSPNMILYRRREAKFLQLTGPGKWRTASSPRERGDRRERRKRSCAHSPPETTTAGRGRGYSRSSPDGGRRNFCGKRFRHRRGRAFRWRARRRRWSQLAPLGRRPALVAEINSVARRFAACRLCLSLRERAPHVAFGASRRLPGLERVFRKYK